MFCSLFGLMIGHTVSRCAHNFVWNATAVQSYSISAQHGDAICGRVVRPWTVLYFPNISDTYGVTYWHVNGQRIFVKMISKYDHVLDFGEEVGEVVLTALKKTVVSFKVLPFPDICGPRRYIFNLPRPKTIGLSSTLTRPKFISNDYNFCLWCVSESKFRLRVHQNPSFDFFHCGESCLSTSTREWLKGSSTDFFRFHSALDFYPSIFPIEFEPSVMGKKDKGELDALLTGSNFTEYVAKNTSISLKKGRWFSDEIIGFGFMAVILSSMVLLGVVLVQTWRETVSEVFVREDEVQQLVHASGSDEARLDKR
jgi:hypothetical protein